ncbi:hypothetical protein P691DRAFT_780137 [Macrolepiota fuliginosa MF-IS2]|uniref:Uncharacterized protein n=1 Tax=Macrolepiota fuliginosa MF-IS2 TaxID=1400762 RepID=A0A9P6BW86_9AGAR|nr:hypothetical protein P691DRAFT_780137 [Macrolepiota fuliginosa MF-IS2]
MNAKTSPKERASTPDRSISDHTRFLHNAFSELAEDNIQRLGVELGDMVLARAIAVIALQVTMKGIQNGDSEEKSEDRVGDAKESAVYEFIDRGRKRRRFSGEASFCDVEGMGKSVIILENLVEEMGKRVDDILEEAKDLNATLKELEGDQQE